MITVAATLVTFPDIKKKKKKKRAFSKFFLGIDDGVVELWV